MFYCLHAYYKRNTNHSKQQLMKKIKANTQKSSDKNWRDEKGINCPYNRTTKLERKKEFESAKALKKALLIQKKLIEFKEEVSTSCQAIYELAMKEYDSEKTKSKGNFTWFNFNRSIKIEVSISERIDFDTLCIEAAKDKLDLFLNDNIQSRDSIIKELVMDAFSNTRGRLDAKKVMSLLGYRSKIKNKEFQAALDLIEKSIRRPDSKKYFRIWAKDDQNAYQIIDLNFSSL